MGSCVSFADFFGVGEEDVVADLHGGETVTRVCIFVRGSGHGFRESEW